MSAKRKTKRGDLFTNPFDFLVWVNNKQWVYFKHKPTSYAWCFGWRLGFILREIRDGHIYRCLNASNGLPFISDASTGSGYEAITRRMAFRCVT